jgi:NAD(P)H dehydrogenase (quinone)
MTDHRNAPLLVTGASGKLGSAMLHELAARGATNVTAASRDPARIAGPATRKVRADFDDAASLDAAFRGIERLLIVSTDALDEPGKRGRQHRAAVEAAARAKVKHIAYTSMTKPGPESLIPFAPDHRGSEEAIRATGIAHTILRNNWYHDNLLFSLPAVLASGRWFTLAGLGRVGYVARIDCAAAAAAALLTEDGSATYDITGPAALTVEEVALAVREVLGTAVSVVQVSEEELARGMRAAGLPEPLVGLMIAFDANTRAGHMDVVSDAVERLSGRKPQHLRDWLAANRVAFGA